MELMAADSWLCGSTNSIVTQQKDVDLFVNVRLGILYVTTCLSDVATLRSRLHKSSSGLLTLSG